MVIASLYEPPAMYPRVLSTLSERFAREAVTSKGQQEYHDCALNTDHTSTTIDVKNMLWRNIPVYVNRLCDGYIMHLDRMSEANFDIYANFKHLGKYTSYD